MSFFFLFPFYRKLFFYQVYSHRKSVNFDEAKVKKEGKAYQLREILVSFPSMGAIAIC